jgi:riboflavin kinase/FMN adenylyltransferase
MRGRLRFLAPVYSRVRFNSPLRQFGSSVTSAPSAFIRGLHNLRPWHRGCVATIGSFDGVHLGHQAILRQLIAAADTHRLPSVVIVFEPQPHEFFSGEKAPARLMRLREKIKALFAAGVERVLCVQFNDTLRGLSARQFIEQVLVQGLGIKHLVVGDDFRFGCDRKGDFNLLQQAGDEFGFSVSETFTLLRHNERVSSTRIRHLLELGEFTQAEELLGRRYSITGRVGYGQQLGRKLGVPTANIHLWRYRSPLHGVFAVTARLENGSLYQGVANIGVKPTISGDRKPILEVHLFNFSTGIYGTLINVVFHHKLRKEQKFSSLDELAAQLQIDIAEAKTYFKNLTS